MTTANTAQPRNLRLATSAPARNRPNLFDRFMSNVELKDRETYTLSKTTVWLVPIILTLVGLSSTLLANYGAFVRSDETKTGDIRLLVDKMQTLNTTVESFKADWKSESKETKLELKSDLQKLQNELNTLEQRQTTLESKVIGIERREGGL